LRGHCVQPRQSPAPARPAPRHPELVTDEPPAWAIQDRRAPHPACPVLHPAAGRKLFDAEPLWADSRAHRATRVASDLIEKTVRRGSETRSSSISAGVSLSWVVKSGTLRSTRAQEGRYPEKAPLSSIPHRAARQVGQSATRLAR